MRRPKRAGLEPDGNDRSPEPGGDAQYIFAEAGSSVYAVIHGDIHIRNGFPVYEILPFPAEARQVSAATARMQPSRLLAADAGIVPFWGRDEELARLAAWRDDPEAGISAMLVHGPGGQGKTRLAARFAADSAAAGWTSWQARHLSDPGSEHVVAPGEPGPALVLIVDYAERWPLDDLGLLLGNPLLRRPERCRVLLIARETGTWWPALRHRLVSKAGITVGPTLALAPLTDSATGRRDVLTAARGSFAAVLSVPALAVDVPRDLDGEAFQLVLTLHMAALVAVDAQARGAVAPADPVGLSAYLLDREHDFWHTLHSSGLISTPPPLIGRTAYIATLTHAQRREQAAGVVQRVRIASAAMAATVLDDHARCYPPLAGRSDSVLEQLYPDRLGEDFVALTTPGHANPDYFPDEWARNAPALLLAPASHEPASPPGYARSALTVLAETARRWPHVADEQLYPLLQANPRLALAAGGATLAAIVQAPGIDVDLLTAIEQWLPDDRHADLDLGIAALAERLTRWRLVRTTVPAEQAVLYQNLGIRLSHAGLYERAAEASSEAVRLYRQANISAPGQYAAVLAEATQNHSVHLSELGRREEARAASEEAVAAFRQLKGDNPDYAASLASALGSHAAHLRDLQRPDEALSAAAEAMAIWRRLNAADQDAFRPDLMRGLQNLAVMLGSTGHPAEALAAAQEAHQAYRRLVRSAPEQFEPGYANALATLAAALSALGRHEETLTATQEALPLCRSLARKNPAAFEPGLAKALNNLGTALSMVGRRGEALPYLHEAADIYGRLTDASPAAFEPRLAAVWHNLGACLARLGQPAEAITATQQAAQIRQRLAAAGPSTHGPDLADSLVSLGMRLTTIGHRDQALVVTVEATSIWRRLAARYPASFEPELADALNELAGRLGEAGRIEEALAIARESTDLYERLAEESPSAFEEDLARAAHNLSVRLAECERHEEALAASRRAADAYRRLAQTVPGRFEPDMAQSLNTLAIRLGEAGYDEDALAAIKEATVIYRRLADASPEAFEPGLAASLGNLCARLSANGRKAQALQVAEEATAIYRRLAAGGGEFRPELAAVLNNLGISLSVQGRRAEGLAATIESAAIYRELAATHPAAFEPDLARALVAVAAEHSQGLSGQQQGFAALCEAAAIYRQLAVAHPAQFEERLRNTLLSAAAALASLGHSPDAAQLRALIKAGHLDAAAETLQKKSTAKTTPSRRAAAAIIRRAARYHGKIAQALTERAQEEIRNDRFEAAISQLDRAIALDPTYEKAHTLRGLARTAIGQHRQALPDLTRALELNPNNALTTLLRGETYLLLERYDNGIADLSAAIALDKTMHEPFTSRGQAFLAMRRFEEAVTDFTAALQICAGDPELLTYRAIALRMLKRYNEAISDLSRAIEADSSHAPAWAERGECHRLQKRYIQAIEDFARALELDSGNAQLYLARGEVCRVMERHEEAIADFAKAIDLDPSLGEAIGQLVVPVFERFTDRTLRTMALAQEEAAMLNHNYIGTEHILLGLLHEGEGLAAKALETLGISLEEVRQNVEEILGKGRQSPSGSIAFTVRAKSVLVLSLAEAQKFGHLYAGTEHVLLGLIREGKGIAAQVLVRCGADLSLLRQQVIGLLDPCD